MSWGTPSKCASALTARVTSSSMASSDSEDSPRSPSAMSISFVPWSPSATIFCSLAPMIVSVACMVSRSTVYVSGVTWPPTTASPRPKLALMIISERSPVAGLAVNRMPDTSDSTINCGRDHRHGDRIVLDAHLVPVGHGPGRPQGCPAVPYGRHDGIGAAYVEVGVLLAGEGHVGEILGVGRRAHRHRRVVALDSLVRGGDLRRHRLGHGVGLKQRLNRLGSLVEGERELADRGLGQFDDLPLQVVVLDEATVGPPVVT